MWYFGCMMLAYHSVLAVLCLLDLLGSKSKTPRRVQVLTLATVASIVTVVAFGFLLFGT